MFMICKPNGTSRMLQDLRAIDGHRGLVRASLRGLPQVPEIPSHFHLTVIDLKDFLLSIPLHEEYCEKFAFFITTVNYT